MIHHCPRCELRFVTEGELREHLALDHGVTEDLRRDNYPSMTAAPLYPDLAAPASEAAEAGEPGARRYLLVANQTLGGQTLLDEVKRRTDDGPASFFVLVPATHSADYPEAVLTYASARAGAASSHKPDDKGQGQARWRLRQTLERLREMGLDVSGEIGSPDPFVAVEQLLRHESVDEIILSTLPAGLSRWLGMDLPHRLERATGLPVTVVETRG